MQTVLWIIGILIFLSGIGAIFRKQVIWGIILIVVGMAVGGFGFAA
jgi:uncharacterized membrane-anchored protein